MEEFFRQNYSLLTYIVEIMAAVAGLFCYKKYKHTITRYFIYFLIYVVLLELIGRYPTYLANYKTLNSIRDFICGTVFESNHWLYTIFWTIGSALFYSFFYRKILKNTQYIKIIKYSSILFLLSTVIYIATHWDAFFISSFPFIKIFGAIVILICVIFYFIEILQRDMILSFYKSLNFCISVVLLIWYIVITPLVFYDIYFSTADWNFVFLRRDIYLYANIFMYSSFAIALLWCKPEND